VALFLPASGVCCCPLAAAPPCRSPSPLKHTATGWLDDGLHAAGSRAAAGAGWPVVDGDDDGRRDRTTEMRTLGERFSLHVLLSQRSMPGTPIVTPRGSKRHRLGDS